MRKACAGSAGGDKACGCGCAGGSEERVPWEGVAGPAAPTAMVGGDVMHLQRLVGNRAVQRLVETGRRAASAPPGVQRAAGGHPTLHKGSKGPAVKQLQQGLGVSADGDFGPKTAEAVIAFQQGHGLAADGVVGPATWAALSGAAGGGAGAGGAGGPGGGGGGGAGGGVGGVGGAGGAGHASAAKHKLLADKLESTTTAVQGAISSAQKPPSASHMFGDDEEEESSSSSSGSSESASSEGGSSESSEPSWLDKAASAASSAYDSAAGAASEAYDSAAGAASSAYDAASGAVDAAAGAVGGAVDAAEGAVGGAVDAAEGAVSDAANAASDAAGYLADVTGLKDVGAKVTEIVNDIKAGVENVVDGAVKVLGEAVSAIEEAARALAKGAGLTDEEIDRLLGLLGGAAATAAAGAQGEELAGGTTKADDIQVNFATGSFTVNYKGLSDLHSQVFQKMSVGHVKMSAAPSMSVTSTDTSGNVASVKIVAKGTASYPAKGSKTGTESADPAREQIGIDNYFSIISSHESSHASIYTTAFTGAAAQLKGLAPAEATTKWNSIVCEAYKSQDSLDKAEGCVEVFGNPAKDASKVAGSSCGNTGTAAQSCP
jgi:hypothetical protein